MLFFKKHNLFTILEMQTKEKVKSVKIKYYKLIVRIRYMMDDYDDD